MAERIGYPVLVRPSYVLGGRAMEIVYDDGSLAATSPAPAAPRPEHPVLIDSFLEDAFEADVDAIADGHEVRHRRRDGAHRGRRDPLGRLRLRAPRSRSAATRSAPSLRPPTARLNPPSG